MSRGMALKHDMYTCVTSPHCGGDGDEGPTSLPCTRHADLPTDDKHEGEDDAGVSVFDVLLLPVLCELDSTTPSGLIVRRHLERPSI